MHWQLWGAPTSTLYSRVRAERLDATIADLLQRLNGSGIALNSDEAAELAGRATNVRNLDALRVGIPDAARLKLDTDRWINDDSFVEQMLGRADAILTGIERLVAEL
jgi:hypothetical protein